MKYLPLPIFLLCFYFPIGITAQITLTQENVPAPGDTLSFARDTTVVEVSVGMAGPDQNWDFSNLQSEVLFQRITSDTTMDPEVMNYPGANLIVTDGQVKTFLQSSDTAVYILGGGVPEAAAFGLEVVRFQPPQKLFSFPITYQDSFTNFYSADVTVDGSVIIPGVDSIRLIRRAVATVTVDSYGTVKTPFNNYETLRQKTETVNMDSIYAQIFGSWRPFTADTSIDLRYEWLSAESKGAVVTAYVDRETGIAETIEFFLDVDNASAPVVAFAYEDQGLGTFSFTDQSTNAPTSWQWTFGDGGSSNEQHPVYSYTTGGEYQVCLTATNFVGSNQSCQTIFVDVIIAVPDPKLEIGVSLYPNPTRHSVLIEPRGMENEQFVFQLFNQQGRTLLQRRFTGQLQLDLSQFPAGIYPYYLQTEGKKAVRWGSGKLQVNPQ